MTKPLGRIAKEPKSPMTAREVAVHPSPLEGPPCFDILFVHDATGTRWTGCFRGANFWFQKLGRYAQTGEPIPGDLWESWPPGTKGAVWAQGWPIEDHRAIVHGRRWEWADFFYHVEAAVGHLEAEAQAQ